MIRGAIVISAILCAGTAQAQCMMGNTGAGCATNRFQQVPERMIKPPPVDIGEIIVRGKYSMLLNARYYGLPYAKDGWVYFRIEDDIYRVDYRTMEVLEKATNEASHNWR